MANMSGGLPSSFQNAAPGESLPDVKTNSSAQFSHDVVKDFNFFKLFQASEKQMWKISDLPWDTLDKQAVPAGLLGIIRATALGELTTYTATQEFMALFADDLDFTAWLSVWFYEETKHPLALMTWLTHFEDRFDSDFIRQGREIHPMRNNRLEMLCMNIVSEITAAQAYHTLYRVVKEPVLRQIVQLLSIDETRHANGFYAYARKMIAQAEDQKLANLTALRVLFYCLYSTEQNHPVNESLTGVSSELDHSVIKVGLEDPNVPKLLLHKFSQLTGLTLANKEDVMINIQELRVAVGENS